MVQRQVMRYLSSSLSIQTSRGGGGGGSNGGLERGRGISKGYNKVKEQKRVRRMKGA
jgi:hypothetical protein